MTRQWLADPEKMCESHIKKEHAETHTLLEEMENGHSLDSYRKGSMFFGADYVKARHDQLATYIKGHGSPLEVNDDIRLFYPLQIPQEADLIKSLTDLLGSCVACKKNHLK